MSIKVSIIVPVYNREKEILQCVKSLINQTLKDIEIIVVDDGSTDNTAASVLGINDSRIKLIQTPNQGQGLARNAGMDIASGQYIGFVDSDDDVNSYMYEKMYAAAQKYNADMVQCCNAFIKNGVTTIKPQLENEFAEIFDSYKYVKSFFCERKHTNGVCNKIFNARFLKENSLRFFDTNEVYSEDLMFNLCLLEKLKRVYFIKDAYYNYNISNEGHFLKAPEKRLIKICALYDKALKRINCKKIKRAVKSTAADHILTYITAASESKAAQKIIKSPVLKGYIINMMLYEKTLRHMLFAIVFIISPARLKKFILKKVYSRYI